MRAFQWYFFTFSTALVIEKIVFEKVSPIPTKYYIKRLLGTTGPAAGFKTLESQLSHFKFQTDATRATGIHRS